MPPKILAVALGCLLALDGSALALRAVSRTAVDSMSVVATTALTPSSADVVTWRDTPKVTRSFIRPPIRRTVRPRTAPTARATAHHTFLRSTSAGAVPAVWVRLAGCEATGNWHDNTGNGFYGGLQITAGNAAHYGFGRPDLLSPWSQVRLARLILRDQGVGAWPVCGPRVGLQPGD